MGRDPTGTIGFGIVSEYSRSLMPIPPQKMTTFTRVPPLQARCSTPACRSAVRLALRCSSSHVSPRKRRYCSARNRSAIRPSGSSTSSYVRTWPFPTLRRSLHPSTTPSGRYRFELLHVVELLDLHDRAVILAAARHASGAHLEAGCVRDDRLLEADLRSVGEGGHHRCVLAPALRPSLLRGRIPVGVLQSLHVPHHPRQQAQPLHPADQVHLHAGLVAVAGGEDLTVPLRVQPQDGPDGGVHLGVHQHHGLLVLEGLEDDARAELDGAGDDVGSRTDILRFSSGSIWSSGFQERSFAEISPRGRGHSRRSRGSSCGSPPSAAGV